MQCHLNDNSYAQFGNDTDMNRHNTDNEQKILTKKFSRIKINEWKDIHDILTSEPIFLKQKN